MPDHVIAPQPTDDDLISRAKQGDQQSFRQLFTRHVNRVVRYASFLGQSWEDSKDIAQEVFIKVFRGISGYRAQGRFLPWLLTITRRVVIDRCRKGSLPQISLEDRPEPPSSLPATPANTPPHLDLLNELSPAHREIVMLAVVEELSYAEIAALTGYSVGTLRKIVCQALRQLREGRNGM